MYKIKLALNTALFILADKLLCGRIKPNEKGILMLSDIRSDIGDNFDCVNRYLEGKGYDIEYDFLPSKKHMKSFGEIIALAKNMSRNKYILLEDFYHYTAYKNFKPEQKLVQLWHGPGAFKKFGYSRVGTGDNVKIHKGYKKYTNVITSSEKINWCYSEAFGVPFKNVKATGVPRTDILFNSERNLALREEFRKTFSIPSEKKVILFAPTYRAANQREAFYDVERLNISMLYEELGDDYILATKFHPAVYENNGSFVCEGYEDFVIDVSHMRNIGDVLPVCDILITDFSSIIFDYWLLNKPIVFFTEDKDDYEEARGMYFDFEKYSFGSVASSPMELIEAIKAEEMDVDKREEFGSTFMSACDGSATEKTCRWIFDDMI